MEDRSSQHLRVSKLEDSNSRVITTTTLTISLFKLMAPDPLHTLLHGLQMLPVQSVLTQTPGHHPTKIFLIHNILELALNHGRRVLSPEEVGLVILVVLSTSLLIRFAILGSVTP